MKALKIVVLLLVMLATAGVAMGETIHRVRFAWDVYPDQSGVSCLKLYESGVTGGQEIGGETIGVFAPEETISEFIIIEDPGTYYFVLTAVALDGSESAPGNEVHKTFKVTVSPTGLRLYEVEEVVSTSTSTTSTTYIITE